MQKWCNELMKSGIYKIVNKTNGKFYVGSAVNIKQRWSIHKHKLKYNKHENSRLQNTWNKYGEGIFDFEIIEETENVNILIEREQFYLDIWQPWDQRIGYNICERAGSRLGTKLTKESKEKIRGENSAVAKLTWDKVNEIRRKFDAKNYSVSDIAREYDVTQATISKIVKNLSWVVENRETITEDLKWDTSGEKNPMYGKQQTEGTKKLISEANKGKIRTQEVKNAARKRMLDRNWTGENHPLFGKRGEESVWHGKTHTEKTKQIIGQKNSGENAGSAVLTWNLVNEIRAKYSSGDHTQRQLAKEYGVSGSTIGQLLRNESWVDPKMGKVSHLNKKYLSGEKNPNFGKKLSDEQKKLLSEVNKGIHAGENNSRAILNWAIVRNMRKDFADGVTQNQIAKKYNYAQGNVSKIIRNLIWVEKSDDTKQI